MMNRQASNCHKLIEKIRTVHSDPCDEIFPPGTRGYYYRNVCIIYVGTIPSTNEITMNIIPKDGTVFNGNVCI